jgi:hypothetical protein
LRDPVSVRVQARRRRDDDHDRGAFCDGGGRRKSAHPARIERDARDPAIESERRERRIQPSFDEALIGRIVNDKNKRHGDC